MDEDIEAIIEASKHFKYHEAKGVTPFNRISALPESKKHLKMAIKERMRLLSQAYISLATFVDDDLVDFIENSSKNDKEKLKEIYRKVIEDINAFSKEIKAFSETELPTLGVSDALDS